MSEKNKSVVKVVSYMMMITLVGKLLGMYREILLANNYGVGMEASAFTTASLIPSTFFDAIFASAISSSFIPVFNEYLEKKGKNEAFKFSNSFITLVGIFTLILTIVGIFAAQPLTAWFADGYDAETMELCIKLVRVLFPTILFTGIAYSFVGILQSLDEFGIPAAMSIASNGIIIIYYFFFNKKFGIYGLAVAFLIGWAMQAIMQIPPLIKKGYKYRFALDIHDKGLHKVITLMLPVMVSTWIQPINIAINTKFASHLFEGAGVSAVNYANKLYTIIVGVFVLSIANVIFPQLSRLTSNNEEEKFGQTINRTVKVLSFMLIPMMVGLMSLSEPIIRLVYERGDFTQFATSITSRSLFFLSMGMFGFGIQTILSRAYYAIQDGKTPLISGAASIIVNIVLCATLVDRFDVAGLALASAISSTVSAIFLIVPMQKRNKDFITKKFSIDLIKMLLSAIVMGIIVLMLRGMTLSGFSDSLISRILVVGIPAVAGIAVYMVLTFILGLEEAKMVFEFSNKFINKIIKRN